MSLLEIVERVARWEIPDESFELAENLEASGAGTDLTTVPDSPPGARPGDRA
jgi:hypothetical protein